MSEEEKKFKTTISGEAALEKLFSDFDQIEAGNITIRSIELAIKKVEFDLKNLRRALKIYRKQNENKENNKELLKG
jgi:hypothetical protein